MEDAIFKLCVVTFFGGGIGSVLRFLVGLWISDRFGESFPWGTLIVNITGCFAIGLIAAISATEGRFMIGPGARQFFMIGMLGGYTTFSSFSLQTLLLARDGEWLYAGIYILLSLLLCLVGVWIGFIAGNAINGLR